MLIKSKAQTNHETLTSFSRSLRERIQSPNLHLSLSIQSPIFMALKEENICLKKQKADLEKLILILSQINMSLEKQHNFLQQHYETRYKDRLIIDKNIAKNVSSQCNDLNYEKSLFQKANHSLKIQIQKEKDLLQKLYQEKERIMLNQIFKRKQTLQNKIVTIVPTNQVLKKKVIIAKQKMQTIDISSFQKNISQLILQIIQIKKITDYKKLNMNKILNKVNKREPFFEQQTQYAKNNIRQLIIELKNLQLERIKCQKLQNSKQNLANKKYYDSIALYKSTIKSKNNFQQLSLEKEEIKKNIQLLLRPDSYERIFKLSNLQKALIKQIFNTKQRIKNKQISFKSECDKIQNYKSRRIQQIKMQIINVSQQLAQKNTQIIEKKQLIQREICKLKKYYEEITAEVTKKRISKNRLLYKSSY